MQSTARVALKLIKALLFNSWYYFALLVEGVSIWLIAWYAHDAISYKSLSDGLFALFFLINLIQMDNSVVEITS